MEVDIEDLQSLEQYLIRSGQLQSGGKWSAKILSGGVSNKAILFSQPENRIEWVIKQALAKLRVQTDWYCDPGRLLVEYKGMQWLSEVLPEGAVPKPVFMDKARFIMAMTAVPQPHDNLKTLLLSGEIDLDLIVEMGQLLGILHQAGYQSNRALSLFNDRSYFKKLRLEPYYQVTAKNLGESGSFFEDLIDQTLAIRQMVVHGDFSPKNMLVKDGRLVLLDHEVMHFGDPAFDLGFCMCHLLSKANHLKPYQTAFLAAAEKFWTSYKKTINTIEKEQEARAVQHTIGCLLARVLGKSPLEYLDKKSQERQVKAGLQLIKAQPISMLELVDRFGILLKS